MFEDELTMTGVPFEWGGVAVFFFNVLFYPFDFDRHSERKCVETALS